MIRPVCRSALLRQSLANGQDQPAGREKVMTPSGNFALPLPNFNFGFAAGGRTLTVTVAGPLLRTLTVTDVLRTLDMLHAPSTVVGPRAGTVCTSRPPNFLRTTPCGPPITTPAT